MGTRSATFAMGCFWSPDARFGATRGVVRTRVGYAGGARPDPTYSDLGDHSETVQLDYDPALISYERLLDLFWSGHNPMKPVWGRQYMSAILCHDEEQRELAQASHDRQTNGGMFRIPTQVLRLGRFYQAEPYHQKHTLRGHAGLLSALLALCGDDESLVGSTAAARINGYLAGFGEIGALAPELAGLGLSQDLSAQIAALVKERRRFAEG